jgi:hypothetical protein
MYALEYCNDIIYRTHSASCKKIFLDLECIQCMLSLSKIKGGSEPRTIVLLVSIYCFPFSPLKIIVCPGQMKQTSGKFFNKASSHFLNMERFSARDGIFKILRSSGIDSARLHTLAGR